MAYPRYRERGNPSSRVHVGSYRVDTNYGKNRGSWTHYYRGATRGSDFQEKYERCWDWVNDGPPYRDGGPLTIIKMENQYHKVIPHSMVHWSSGNYYRYVYDGGFTCGGFPSHFMTPLDMMSIGDTGPYGADFNDPEPYATEAYDRFSPKPQLFDGGTFVGELKDLPKMFKDASQRFNDVFRGSSTRKAFSSRTVGQDWLSYHFGWAPFVRDLYKLQNLYRNYDRAFARLRRQNNKWTKRYGSVLQEYSQTDVNDHWSENGPNLYPTLTSANYRFPVSGRPLKFGNWIDYKLSARSVWYEAVQKFYVPIYDRVGQSEYHRRMATIRSLGLTVSPSVVWNLLPWSWMADWFSNAGSIANNITNTIQNGLTSKYAYIMSHQKVQHITEHTAYFAPGDRTFRFGKLIESKRRWHASPFGFGLKSGTLSPYQWSILGALGLSWGRRK